MKRTKLFLISALLPLVMSCGNSNQNDKQNSNNETQKNQETRYKNNFSVKIDNLDTGSIGKIGDKYYLSIAEDSIIKVDSSLIKVDGKTIAVLGENELTYTIDTKNFRCGIVPVSVEIHFNGKTETPAASVKLMSDITPKTKSYKVVKTYNHDREAYTQGLIYEDGYFYESTGLNRKSSLRKVKIENGEVLQSKMLEDQYFGEGLATIDDRLIQLTWRSNVGFVYDKKTFNKIQDFPINVEGWGLTNVGDTLLLTDGTENIYFLESKSFTQQKYVQVYDNLGPVKMLNESEIINGKLYCNIYQSDMIAVIDYHTGKVLNYINLSGILPTSQRDNTTDVLNGIAYDEKNNKLYVTGKNWPKLYEIKIID
ncbi:MAG: glutaminyl-peptide cyclotransferase [Bacteroidales bacterium]|nr:glutaminyl-peptide cyclotransferase [Bacteroidales bacterium]